MTPKTQRCPKCGREMSIGSHVESCEFCRKNPADSAPETQQFSSDVTFAPTKTFDPGTNTTFGATVIAGETAGSSAGPAGTVTGRGAVVHYFGDYEIEEQIGRGGMGVVYRARQISLNRPVALKLVRAGILADDADLRRFQVEAEAIALLDHPGIVSIYEVGTHDGQKFLSMKLVDGGTLSDRLRDASGEFQSTAALMIEAATAIQHAHMRGILHRDLKPSNVLVDGKGKPCISDFGLAKFVKSDLDLTASGDIVGTPAYMSPEQAAGKRGSVTVATDVYGLGAILYAMLTGSAPFRGDSVVETLEAVRHRLPFPPRKIDAAIPRDLELICLKCLEKSPVDRYPTAEALADDLRRWSAGEPVSVRAPGTMERIAKWARRKPTLAAAYSLAFLAVTLGSLASLAAWNWRAASIALDLANESDRLARSSLKEAEYARSQEEKARNDEAKARAEVARLLQKTERIEYGRTIELALREWQKIRVGSARNLLASTLPELRGWEWNYVKRLCDSDLLKVQAHESNCDLAAFSTDGSMIVSSGGDGAVRLWRTVDGDEIRSFRVPDAGLSFGNLDRDAKRLVTACSDNSLRIWDVVTGAEVRKIEAHEGRIKGASFSSAGDRILSCSEDGTVKVWDAASGAKIFEIEADPNWAAFSPDGSRIVIAGNDRNAIVRDARTGEMQRTLTGHTDIVGFATFSPDGKKILTASGDDTAKLWNAETGAEIRTFKGHSENVAGSGFSPDGSKIVTASMDGSARIWNATTGEMQHVIRGHSGFVWSSAFAPSGNRVLTSGVDGTWRIWDPEFRPESLRFSRHVNEISAAAFSPDGKEVISCTGDGAVKIWNARTLAERLSIQADKPLWACGFTPDGNRFAFSASGSIKIHDTKSGTETMTLKGHAVPVVRLQFAPDGSKLFSTDIEGTSVVWNLADGKPLRTFKGMSENAFSTTFSPDGTRVLGVGKNVVVQDTMTGAEIASFPAPSEHSEFTDFSPDGKRILIVADQVVHVLDATTGASLVRFEGHTDTVRLARFSPDGTRVATASQDNTVKLWDLVSGAEVLTLEGHTHYVSALDFSRDGQRIVTGGWDRSVILWDSAPIDRRENAFRAEADAPVAP